MMDNINPWDLVLVLVVSLQSTVLAYLHKPKWKAFILSLPIPFTVAAMAVSRPIDATNLMGLLMLCAFYHGVRTLHHKGRVPIIPAIAASVASFALIAWFAASKLPHGETMFWTVAALNACVAIGILTATRPREERGHRTSLPVWQKLPIIIVVVISVLAVKSSLHGFVTTFPLVSIVGLYESRHSLWTISRQMTVAIVGLTAFMIACRLVQTRYGMPLGLCVGWIVYGAMLFLIKIGARSRKLALPEDSAIPISLP